MAFTKAVKEKVLVAAGRRCCICRRFKGVLLEVHHIRPQSAGGRDDIDNAIPLCFDCHADVGHYNPSHPRGNRYSSAELRRHRDRLYREIQSGVLQPARQQEEWAYCRYLVCRSFSALSELVKGDLDHLPAESPVLLPTPALKEMQHLVQVQQSSERGPTVSGDHFPNSRDYYSKYRSVLAGPIPEDGDYPYFLTVRIVDAQEIRRKVGPHDPISLHLLETGVPPAEVCVALGYEESCGEDGFQEVYETRQVWSTFLEIRNVSSNPVRFCELEGLVDASEPRFTGFSDRSGTPWCMQLPAAQVLPKQSVVVPLGVLLAPLKVESPTPLDAETSEVSYAHYQSIGRADLAPLAQGLRIYGTLIRPSLISGSSLGVPLTQQIHDLDLSRVYTLDRDWAMGSCPFLFFVLEDGSVKYIRELFSARPWRLSGERLVVPTEVNRIVVAELEREVTYLECMLLNGRRERLNLRLGCGDRWELPVTCGDEIQLFGWYVPELLGRQDPLIQNQVIRKFIDGLGFGTPSPGGREPE